MAPTGARTPPPPATTSTALGVQFQYINIERDAHAQAWVKAQNGGKQKTPTLDIAGQILSVPDERQLEEALRGTGLMG